MCDTLGKILSKGKHAIFAKNSDRENDEPQIVQFIPAKTNKEKTLQTTYLCIEQVEKTYAIFISKPVWLWGAEMGVNEYGVCIGNEALYPNIYDNPTSGLLGMDLVRLGLERSKSAKEALDIIINLLEKYGQGGFCSLKNKNLYDNAFFIMDINEAYILETKNKHWLYKKVNQGCISNVFSVTKPDNFSDIKNFKKVFRKNCKHSGDSRLKLMKKPLKTLDHVMDAINILKMHHKKDKDNPTKKYSICMHGDYATTGSLVVELLSGKPPKVFFTATSNPCKSLFLPYQFGEKLFYPINTENEQNIDYWKNFNDTAQQQFLSKEKLDDLQNKLLSGELSVEENIFKYNNKD